MPPVEPTIGGGGGGGGLGSADGGKRKRKDGEQRKLTPEEQYQVGADNGCTAGFCCWVGCWVC
jgi:hypothetical protein